ncbi:MAG: ribokinase [Chloroflexi bacterium]|nr:ribokinase [Chloroflexota bacterium]
MSIVVFGSINMDLVARTPRLPAPGETLIGHAFQTFPGGKGANQAVACARLSSLTWMVGRVGGDVFGDILIEELAAAGVNHTFVEVDPAVSSGVAIIAVDDQAENNIIVIPGANGNVGRDDLPRLEKAMEGAKILLLQLEIPMDVVVAAAKLAKEKAVTVILDPAPAQELPDELYSYVDIITPNETEAAALVGLSIKSVEDAEGVGQDLLIRGVNQVIVKMGGLGAHSVNSDGGKFYPAIPVDAVDTVAAGDAFNGALAVALSDGEPIEKAIRWGIAGGALAVTKEGAQPAMPERKELLALLKTQQ